MAIKKADIYLVISNGAEFPEQTDNLVQRSIFGAETPDNKKWLEMQQIELLHCHFWVHML